MTDKEREYIRTLKSLVADFIRDKQPEDVSYYQEVCDWLDSLPMDSKIGQIKAKLQKRLLKYDPDMTNAGRELQEVLAFIDSFPAETASPELEREIDSFFKNWDKNSNGVLFTELGMAVNLSYVKTVARHFANWQKRQDDELLTIAHFDGVQSGKEAERKELLEWAKQEQYESTTIVTDDFWQKVIDKLKKI